MQTQREHTFQGDVIPTCLKYMKMTDATNGAKRMRDNKMAFEWGGERYSNALTKNIEHNLIV